jgi:predicted Zn-dependent protease with MMP-like domain
MDRFERAVRDALQSIPAEFQPYLEDIEFVIEESSPDGLLGLYEGETALGGDWPQRVAIFKRSHEDEANTWEELVDEVRRTVLHEVGHHFGMDEHDLPY